MKFEDEGPISTTINGVQINFDVPELCQILDIPNEGVCLYEAKKWPRWKVLKLKKLYRGYVVIQNLVDQLLIH